MRVSKYLKWILGIMSVSVFGMVLFFQIGTAWANALGAVCLFWVVCCTIAIPVIVILDDESP